MPRMPLPHEIPNAPSIFDFIDVHNPEHLKAIDELNKTGFWPKNFLPAGLEVPTNWQFTLFGKLGAAWLAHSMEAGGLKAKLHQAKVRLMNLGDHRPEVETAVAVMGEVEHTLLA